MKQPTLLLNTTQTITTLLLWLVFYVAHGQAPNKDLQQYMPQPFIHKIELVFGPSLNIPNDHGWAEYYKKLFSGNNLISFKFHLHKELI